MWRRVKISLGAFGANRGKDSRKMPMERAERVRVVWWRGLCLGISTKALTSWASSGVKGDVGSEAT
jgi:hypothetical protein